MSLIELLQNFCRTFIELRFEARLLDLVDGESGDVTSAPIVQRLTHLSLPGIVLQYLIVSRNEQMLHLMCLYQNHF